MPDDVFQPDACVKSPTLPQPNGSESLLFFEESPQPNASPKSFELGSLLFSCVPA